MSLLTSELLKEFLSFGIVVIPNVLSEQEIAEARKGLHEYLINNQNINHDDILDGKVDVSNQVRKKGECAELFYSKFKMNIHLREDIYLTFKDLLQHINPTHSNLAPLPYIDRVCWRLPDHIRPEGGLKLHIDRNPWTHKAAKKNRNVQAFVSLTDQYGSNSGGLRVVKGFHSTFDEYFAKSYNEIEANASGEFYRMNGKEHTKAQNELVHIDAPAGSLVIWHNNLPHATCDKLISYDSREVLYLTYLPNEPMNIKYWKEQAKNFISNIPPPSYYDTKQLQHTSSGKNTSKCDRNYEIKELSQFQLKLLGV
jgi:hypothetical protein